jgi:hypothetical protein
MPSRHASSADKENTMTIRIARISGMTTGRALLAAGLLIGAAAAQAATGYNVSGNQELQIKPGMTSTEVLQTLGHPSDRTKFRNEPGPTYEYRVLGHPAALFDVDFDASGHVASATERINPLNSRGAFGSF